MEREHGKTGQFSGPVLEVVALLYSLGFQASPHQAQH